MSDSGSRMSDFGSDRSRALHCSMSGPRLRSRAIRAPGLPTRLQQPDAERDPWRGVASRVCLDLPEIRVSPRSQDPALRPFAVAQAPGGGYDVDLTSGALAAGTI